MVSFSGPLLSTAGERAPLLSGYLHLGLSWYYSSHFVSYPLCIGSSLSSDNILSSLFIIIIQLLVCPPLSPFGGWELTEQTHFILGSHWPLTSKNCSKSDTYSLTVLQCDITNAEDCLFGTHQRRTWSLLFRGPSSNKTNDQELLKSNALTKVFFGGVFIWIIFIFNKNSPKAISQPFCSCFFA